MKLALLFALVPMLCSGLDRFTALSLIETGDNDAMVGRAGEISRYQVMKNEWRAITPSTSYRNADLAKQVAVKILDQRVQRFESIYKRPPTDFEFYALWNAPTQAFTGHISRVVAERCQRFANLCNWKDSPVAAVKSESPDSKGFPPSGTAKAKA
jgi:hypothetical protein